MSEVLLHDKAKSGTDTDLTHNPIQYRQKENCFRAHSSADTIGYETTQQTSHSCASADKALLPTTPTLSLGKLLMHHGLLGESCLVE